jgi:hypothetical protein
MISIQRWAPTGKYLKDHYLLKRGSLWHIFCPIGAVGTIWTAPGSEESAEHFISEDLENWTAATPQTALVKSGISGRYDYQMGGIAPHVIESEGIYWMFHAGWSFNSKGPPYDGGNGAHSIGAATSPDLFTWTRYPGTEIVGLSGVFGTDPCVIRDVDNSRWLLYSVTEDVNCFTSANLTDWTYVGVAATAAELSGMQGAGNHAESPLIMRHPISSQWILIMNGGYSVSDDPTNFPTITNYPFVANWVGGSAPTGNWGDGTNMLSADAGAGYAHQVIEHAGQWYMSGVVGTDGHERLKLTPITWTSTALVASTTETRIGVASVRF